MRACALLLPLLLSGCGTPDRWNFGVSRGEGSLDGYRHDYDTEDTRLEVGVSGPLGLPRAAPRPERPPEPCPLPSPPTSQPEPSGGIPWVELALILAGALGGKASEVGYRKVKSRKSA